MGEFDHGKQEYLRIGMLIDWVDTQYQTNILRGVVDYAEENGINFLCFEGGAVNSKREYETQRNILFDLANKENVDGLIILSATIGHFSNLRQIKDFYRKYEDLPLVSVAVDLEDITSIMIDNATGLKKMLAHLIKDHNYRNIAFIAGPRDNQDSAERLEIFKATLQEYGLVFKPELVIEGDYTPLGGKKAVKRLFAKNSPAKIDAIVAANDEMALGVLEELRLKQVRVPHDTAVVGFDNLEISSYSSPPLTTVAQPLYEQGRQAAKALTKLINKETVPQKIIVPTRPVFRESCGCLSVTTVSAAKSKFIQSTGSQGNKKLENSLKEKPAKLFDALQKQLLTKKSKVFLETCYDLLQEALWTDEDIFSWQIFLSELRYNLASCISADKVGGEIEDLWHQARVMIGEKAILKEKIKHHESIQTNTTLNLLREELLVTLNMQQLIEVLAQRLPELGVTGCYLSKFCADNDLAGGAAKLILAYNEQGRLKIDENRPVIFDSCQLVPPGLQPAEKQHAWFVVSLNFAKTQFGFVVFEVERPDGALYGALRRIICNALQGVMLSKQLQAQEIEIIAQQEHLRNMVKLRKIMEGFIQTIAVTVEKRDPYTAGHQKRVAFLARAVAKEMSLPAEKIEAVRMAGIVHDLGKIYVPAEILNKPGRLLDIEFNLIKNHARVGYDILKAVDFPWPIAKIILQHHERLNGSGYPLALKRNEIVLEAKILAVADVIEAMASHRPYRAALSIDTALDEIFKNRGVLYEPAVVDACLRLFKKGFAL